METDEIFNFAKGRPNSQSSEDVGEHPHLSKGSKGRSERGGEAGSARPHASLDINRRG